MKNLNEYYRLNRLYNGCIEHTIVFSIAAIICRFVKPIAEDSTLRTICFIVFIIAAIANVIAAMVMRVKMFKLQRDE